MRMLSSKACNSRRGNRHGLLSKQVMLSFTKKSECPVLGYRFERVEGKIADKATNIMRNTDTIAAVERRMPDIN